MDNLSQKLSQSSLQEYELAVKNGDFLKASMVFQDAGLYDEAIQFCESKGLPQEAYEIAVKTGKLDKAERIARQNSLRLQLANVLILRGRLEEASDIFCELNMLDKAAKLLVKIGQLEKAGILYAKNHKYLNAVECYQKSGNVIKQLEMSVKAFEDELALANGDLSVTSVSRAMAVAAARRYLTSDDMRSEGIRVLNEANALAETAENLEKEGKFAEAALCYESCGENERAIKLYARVDDFKNALRTAKATKNDELEIKVLQYFNKHFRLGQKYIELNRLQDALEAFKQIDNNNANYSNGLEMQGDIYCRLKNYNDAVTCYESLLWQQLPKDCICRVAFKAGYCYETLSDYDNALRHYSIVQNIDPKFHDISSIVLKLRDKQKRYAHEFEDSLTREKKSVLASGLGDRRRLVSMTGQIRTRERISTVMLGSNEVVAVGSERYKNLVEIAHGGMGVVYKATDSLLERTVALKVLANKLRDNSTALEYFMREAKASAKLQHINIVTIYDIGSLNDGTIYMAMEFIEGKNLKELVQEHGAFGAKFLTQIAMHACRGLQYAHENGIIHRDIKSSNMMIAKKDKMLKICDLGLAKMASDERNSTQAVGTPYYMSPEQVLGDNIDCRSDIYSLGVTLYELACGCLPFVKGDLPYKHVHELPPPPTSFNPQMNPDVERIILKMMEKKPDDRFASCDEVADAFKHIHI